MTSSIVSVFLDGERVAQKTVDVPAGGFKDIDFSGLRACVGGGMAVQRPVAEEWQKVTGKPLIEAFGLTETSPAACINPPQLEGFNGSIGLPISSTEVSIRDDDGNELGLNEIGELCIRGPQVMAGYWQRPEETDKTMFPDGWLRTGDMARSREGACECGRPFPLLESVEGRTSELLVGRNGRLFSCPGPRFYGSGIPGIHQMQLVQESLDELVVNIVPDGDWTPASEEMIVARMKELLGDPGVVVNLVDSIPPAPSGKFPFAVSKVSPFQDPKEP